MVENQGRVLPIGQCVKVVLLDFVLVSTVPCLCNLEVHALTPEEAHKTSVMAFQIGYVKTSIENAKSRVGDLALW